MPHIAVFLEGVDAMVKNMRRNRTGSFSVADEATMGVSVLDTSASLGTSGKMILASGATDGRQFFGGQELGVEQCAVQGAVTAVDSIARTERIQRMLGTRVPAAGQHQGPASFQKSRHHGDAAPFQVTGQLSGQSADRAGEDVSNDQITRPALSYRLSPVAGPASRPHQPPDGVELGVAGGYPHRLVVDVAGNDRHPPGLGHGQRQNAGPASPGTRISTRQRKGAGGIGLKPPRRSLP